MNVVIGFDELAMIYCNTDSGPRKEPGPYLNIKTVFAGMGISMLKIRWLRDHLIFNMGIHILVR